MSDKNQDIRGLPIIDKKDIPEMPKCKSPKKEIKIKKLTELEPGKVYILSCPTDLGRDEFKTITTYCQLIKDDLGINILPFSDILKFQDVPKETLIDLICEDIKENGKIRDAINSVIDNEHGHD